VMDSSFFDIWGILEGCLGLIAGNENLWLTLFEDLEHLWDKSGLSGSVVILIGCWQRSELSLSFKESKFANFTILPAFWSSMVFLSL